MNMGLGIVQMLAFFQKYKSLGFPIPLFNVILFEEGLYGWYSLSIRLLVNYHSTLYEWKKKLSLGKSNLLSYFKWDSQWHTPTWMCLWKSSLLFDLVIFFKLEYPRFCLWGRKILSPVNRLITLRNCKSFRSLFPIWVLPCLLPSWVFTYEKGSESWSFLLLFFFCWKSLIRISYMFGFCMVFICFCHLAY